MVVFCGVDQLPMHLASTVDLVVISEIGYLRDWRRTDHRDCCFLNHWLFRVLRKVNGRNRLDRLESRESRMRARGKPARFKATSEAIAFSSASQFLFLSSSSYTPRVHFFSHFLS
jgi:hypothetical protein